MQSGDHPNTRWECAFETRSRDEYLKHCKNIQKRSKWRDQIVSIKPDPHGVYRCSYNSTDRHHVENHFQKGNTGPSLYPSPESPLGTRYKNYWMQQHRHFQQGPGGKAKSSKRWVNFALAEGKQSHGDDDEEGREFKRFKTDLNSMSYFDSLDQEDNEREEVGVVRAFHVSLPDSVKIEEVFDAVIRKIDLAKEVVDEGMEKLQKSGYFVIGSLKNLRKDAWERLSLPRAVEDELRQLISSSKSLFSHYGYAYYGNHPHTQQQYSHPAPPPPLPVGAQPGSLSTGVVHSVTPFGAVPYWQPTSLQLGSHMYYPYQYASEDSEDLGDVVEQEKEKEDSKDKDSQSDMETVH